MLQSWYFNLHLLLGFMEISASQPGVLVPQSIQLPGGTQEDCGVVQLIQK